MLTNNLVWLLKIEMFFALLYQDRPTLVGLNSLPFGAIGSVTGFLRVSFAVWWIGLFGLGVAWSAYFDDFSIITRPELESSTNWAVTSLFDLIGLEFAREGPKCPHFSPIFKMLGLTLYHWTHVRAEGRTPSELVGCGRIKVFDYEGD